MRKLLASMAVNLGKRAALVGVVVAIVTAVLGFGATKLEFATGQDSYLNSDDEVYVDNVAYQDLFGGQAMLTLFTMDEGRTVADLFTPANVDLLQSIEEELSSTEGALSVVTPLTAMQFTQQIVTTAPDGTVTPDPTQSVAGLALLGAREREEPGSEAAQLRLDDRWRRRPAWPRCRRRSARSTTPRGSSSSCSTTAVTSARRCAPSSRTSATRSSSPASRATPTSRPRAPQRRPSRARSTARASRTPRSSPPARRCC
jgi:hypothetical protein